MPERTVPSGGATVLLLWAGLGAGGGSVLYAVNLGPSLGARSKNAAGILLAALVGAILWNTGVSAAWTFPAAWCGAFLLLWASQFEVGTGDLTSVRAVAATALVILMMQFFR
jgi:hypothetical protein